MQEGVFQKHNEAGVGLVRQSKSIIDISHFRPRLNVLRAGHWRKNPQPHHDMQHVRGRDCGKFHSGMDPLSRSSALPAHNYLSLL